MAAALDELNLRVGELKANLAFVSLAAQLRPRVADVVNWDSRGEVLDLTKTFMAAKTGRPESIYGYMLIGLLAAFERYLRMLVVERIEERVAIVKKYDDLPIKLAQRNLVLTGRVLSTMDAPRDHLAIDTESLIDNLASCKRGGSSFRLNAQAFSATVTGTSPAAIEKALDNADISGWWDEVGGSSALAKILGTKGARATGIRASERLKELWRWRNHLAHGGDEEIALSDLQLREAVDFVASFGEALDKAVSKRNNA